MDHLSTLLPLVTILIAVGAFAGVLAGLLGVGGGIVLVPAFFYLFSGLGYGSDGLMQVCVATSMATIIITSTRSVTAHARKGAVDWHLLRDWAPWVALGALAGVALVAHLDTHALTIIFGTLVLAIALYMAFGKQSWRIGEGMPGLGFRLWFGPLMGAISVLLGIGGGSISTPMQTLHGIPIHRAVATSAGFGAIMALPSTIAFFFTHVENAPPFTLGAVNIPALAVIGATTAVTAAWGAALAHKLDPKPLKRIFAGFLMLVALNMLRKALL
jgi:uncharacterized membrane protein YfcA